MKNELDPVTRIICLIAFTVALLAACAFVMYLVCLGYDAFTLSEREQHEVMMGEDIQKLRKENTELKDKLRCFGARFPGEVH